MGDSLYRIGFESAHVNRLERFSWNSGEGF